ncbi:MAG: complex I subunit 4 family protein [bacterium JZ-2024 1]
MQFVWSSILPVIGAAMPEATELQEFGYSVEGVTNVLRALFQNPTSLAWLIPLMGCILLATLPATNDRFIRYYTVLVTLVTLIPIVHIYRTYDWEKGELGLGLLLPWFPYQFGINYAVAVDGISVVLLMLTGILFVTAAIGSWSVTKRIKDYSFLFLLLEASIIGVFVAMDYVLFFIFWELMLLPMYFLIGIWGGPRRIYAAIKFFLFTLAGSVAILIGIIILWQQVPSPNRTFLVPALWSVGPQMAPGLASIVFLLFFFGFGVKVPIVPLHTWLPDAHVEAPTPISVILAGLLLKTGAYGFYRFLYPTFPQMAKEYALFVAAIGVIMIVYAALVAMAQADLKTLIAYASISHMGYVLLGIATLTHAGMTAGVFQMVSHGFVSGSLFLLAGVIYDRAHTRIINEFGGLGTLMPKYFAFFILAGMANLALPPLSGFWGEAFAYLGAFSNHFYYSDTGTNLFWLLALFAVPGIVVTAGYTLWAIQRVFMGPLNERWKDLTDLSRREILSLALPGLFIVLIGVQPSVVIQVFNSSLNNLLNHILQNAPFG